MAAGTTAVADIIVPSVFSPYVQTLTQEKSRLIRSGAMARSSELDADLAGGGLTFNQPFYKDLDNDADNVSTDQTTDVSTPNKITGGTEIQVRLSRNNSWSTADLAGALAGSDPAAAIANRVADYWVRREQAVFVATMTGILANNAAATDAYHVQNDMIHNISGASYVDGLTNFSSEAFIDTTQTMGDSMDNLSMIMVHSIVYNRMLKNNLIDFIVDSSNSSAYPNTNGVNKGIPTFLGRIVIVDDGLPNTGGVFQSWLFGMGAFQNGQSSPKVPTEVERSPTQGNGGGVETLFNRVEWILHAVGHAYVGTPAKGGPSNAATSNNLGNASSWRRVFAERKQIKIASLVTREY